MGVTFIILFLLMLIIIWYLLARFFEKIGDLASKSAKPFTKNLNNKGEKNNDE